MNQATLDKMQTIFETDAVMQTHLKNDLTYNQMVLYAEWLEDWGHADVDKNPERAASLLGMAAGVMKLAQHVGEDWTPVLPEDAPSIVAEIARYLEKESA